MYVSIYVRGPCLVPLYAARTPCSRAAASVATRAARQRAMNPRATFWITTIGTMPCLNTNGCLAMIGVGEAGKGVSISFVWNVSIDWLSKSSGFKAGFLSAINSVGESMLDAELFRRDLSAISDFKVPRAIICAWWLSVVYRGLILVRDRADDMGGPIPTWEWLLIDIRSMDFCVRVFIAAVMEFSATFLLYSLTMSTSPISFTSDLAAVMRRSISAFSEAITFFWSSQMVSFLRSRSSNAFIFSRNTEFSFLAFSKFSTEFFSTALKSIIDERTPDITFSVNFSAIVNSTFSLGAFTLACSNEFKAYSMTLKE